MRRKKGASAAPPPTPLRRGRAAAAREPDPDEEKEEEEEEEEEDDKTAELPPELNDPEPALAATPLPPPPPIATLRSELSSRLDKLNGSGTVTIEIERLRPPGFDGFLAKLEGENVKLLDDLKSYAAREWGGGEYQAEVRLGGEWVGQRYITFRIAGPPKPVVGRNDPLDNVAPAIATATPSALDEVKAKLDRLEQLAKTPPAPNPNDASLASIVSTAITALSQKASAPPASSPEMDKLRERIEASEKAAADARAALERERRDMKESAREQQLKAVNRQLARIRKTVKREMHKEPPKAAQDPLVGFAAAFTVVDELKKRIQPQSLRDKLDGYVSSLIDRLPAPAVAAEEIRRQSEAPPPMPARGGDEEAAFRAWSEVTLNHFPKSLEASRLREALERWPEKTRRFGALRTREDILAFAKAHGTQATVDAIQQLPADQLAALVARLEAIDKALAAVAAASQQANQQSGAAAPGSG